jgi:ABC-type Zn uptake system ZnuABC Zn-binding protein ZnuA
MANRAGTAQRSVGGGWLCAAAALVLCVLAACERPKGSAAPPNPGVSKHTIHIVATIPPIGGLVNALLENQNIPHDVATLVPPGASEHGFELTPDNLKSLATADVVVMVGLGMEPQVEKFLKDHPRPETERRVVVMAEIPRIRSEIQPGHHDDEDHHHHDGTVDAAHDDHDHDHAGGDPHIWLDPVLVQHFIFGVSDAIESRLGPDEKARWRLERASTALVQDIAQVDTNYRVTLKEAQRRTIIVGHDAFGYLARRYNLKVVAISGLNAGEPRPDDLKKAADAVRDDHLTTIFVEPQLGSAAGKRLAKATGAQIAVLDPLGDGDWFKLMENNLAALREALGIPAMPLPSPHGPRQKNP